MAKGKSTGTAQQLDVPPRVTRSRNNTEHIDPVSPPTQKRSLPDSALSQSPSKRVKRTLEHNEPEEVTKASELDRADSKVDTESNELPEQDSIDAHPAQTAEQQSQNFTSQPPPPPSPRTLDDTERADPPSPQVRNDHEAHLLSTIADVTKNTEDGLGSSEQPVTTELAASNPLEEPNKLSIRTDPMSWVRQQLLINLELLAKQILTLFMEIEPNDWLQFEGSKEESALRRSWRTLRSLFEQAESNFNHDDSSINPTIAFNASTSAPKASLKTNYLVDLTSALLILMKSDQTYDELKHVNNRFLDIFRGQNNTLQDWQIRLGTDIRKETWRLGVFAQAFNEHVGLKTLFEDNVDALPHPLRRKSLERRAEIQQDMNQHLSAKVNFGHVYGPELRDFSNRARTIPPSTEDIQTETSDIPLPLDHEEGLETSNADENSNSVQELAATAHLALNGHSEAETQNYQTNKSTAAEATGTSSPGGAKSPGMIAFGESLWSTREAYERAKLAAAEKAAARHKGIPLQPSQRRPWSPEEENALMTGLDRVQGPHWSQILAMYGPGGSISEVLKDRNQVQLKDKARNLKLFFLKSGHDVPHYLKNVTGELKTRAPNRGSGSGSEKRALEEIYGNDQSGNSSSRPNTYLSAQLFARPTTDKGGAAEQANTGSQSNRSMEEDEDLSNAIQLALEAIREKNGQQGEAEDESNANDGDSRPQKTAESTGDSAVAAGS